MYLAIARPATLLTCGKRGSQILPHNDAMPSADSSIAHVSDTALMVAAVRAHETQLEDAYFHDPFAARLAGDRGAAILNALPYASVARFGLAVRVRLLDDLLRETLSAYPIKTVLSVGCGLDTRPWRLDLPPTLRWVEVDFADVLDYKEKVMSAETPRCRRERLVADLNDSAQRRAIYQAAGSESTLMITEGVLMYLSAGTIEALASEVPVHSSVAHWISDITTTGFRKALGGGSDTMSPIRHVQAPDALEGEQILEVLNRHGWTTAALKSYIRDVAFARPRVLRMMGGKEPPVPPFPPGDPTGVHRFGRQ